MHFADVFSKLLGCFCCADEACNHDSHYPQELFLPVSHIGKAARGNLHCLCRQSLPGAVNMATFLSGIFTKYVEEISLKIMGTNYTLLTQAYSFRRFPVLALIYTVCVPASSLQHTKLYSEEFEQSPGAEFLQEVILMNVARNTRLFLSLMRYFACSPPASFLVSKIEYI